MIFVVLTSNEDENRKLLEEAVVLQAKKYTFNERKQLNKSLYDSKRGDIFDSSSEKPLARLKQGEKLYVLGHGDRRNPSLSDQTPEQLAELLMIKGLNLQLQNLRINLVCCHSGHTESESEQSFAHQLYSSLLRRIKERDSSYFNNNNSLFAMKAPKCLVRYTASSGKAEGIPSDKYALYLSNENNPNWIEANTKKMQPEDYQYLGSWKAK